MSPHPLAETIEAPACSVSIRRYEGPVARELHFLVEPVDGSAGAGAQAEAIDRAIHAVLDDEGASPASVVTETVFLRDLRADLATVRDARARAIDARDPASPRPATLEIEQPPLDGRARLAVAVQAILPEASPPGAETITGHPACGCDECARAHGVRLRIGPEVRFHAAGLYGAGADAHARTRAMFEAAEDLLDRAGLSFRDVVRTWIHLREMDRDYAAFNAARRAFFAARGIDPAPASTGIGGGPAPAGHDLCLGLFAVRTDGPVPRTPMHTPTLNEASAYGADFVRGMRVEEANRIALHVSGTASVDEAGRTAHPGDFDAQVDRMLLNVAALLEGQGAGYGDVLSAVTYLKRRADAPRLRARLREAGFDGFPNALVEAPVCRPDLLCETEALAVLPRAGLNGSGR